MSSLKCSYSPSMPVEYGYACGPDSVVHNEIQSEHPVSSEIFAKLAIAAESDTPCH